MWVALGVRFLDGLGANKLLPKLIGCSRRDIQMDVGLGLLVNVLSGLIWTQAPTVGLRSVSSLSHCFQSWV